MVRTAIHPGEHLAEELTELGISAAELSRQIEVPVNRVTSIINGERGVTADTALRLGHWFGTKRRILAQFAKALRAAESSTCRTGYDPEIASPHRPEAEFRMPPAARPVEEVVAFQADGIIRKSRVRLGNRAGWPRRKGG